MKRIVGMTIAATWVCWAPAFADVTGDPTLDLLKQMQTQLAEMQRTIEAQNLRIQQLESSKVLETAQPSVPMQPAAAAPMSDQDFQKSLKDNLGDVVPFLKGAKFGGDFRLRHEYFDYFDKTAGSGTTDRSRNRFRVRLRWGFEKDYGDDWKMGFRLATGSTTDQASTNQTLGNPGYFNFKSFNIEKAYALYSPNGLKDFGPLKGVTIGGGKVENPFLRYATPIVWDGDVTPEGLYEQANVQVLGTEDHRLNLKTTLGQFAVNENSGNESDANLWAYQTAATFSTYGFGTEQPVDFTGAVSYYDYDNWSQTVANNSAGTNYLRTNTLVADNFEIVDYYPEVQFHVGRRPVTLWYNYVENIGNVGNSDPRGGGNPIHDDDTAWGVGVKFGKVKDKGQWDIHYGYYEIGANAVVAAFNDSDFGGPGGSGHTNRVGHKLGFGYGLTKNVVLNWTGFIVEPLRPFNGNSTIGGQNSASETVFRHQLDLNFKF